MVTFNNQTNQPETLRVTHIITGLALGGAEMMLFKLVKSLEGSGFENRVISVTGNGLIGEKLKAKHIPVKILGMKANLPNPLSVLRLVKWLRAEKPHLVQTWMYHANLIGGIAAWLAGDLPLVWGIHNSTLDRRQSKHSTMLAMRICAKLSTCLPDRIVSCSHKAGQVHADIGYAQDKIKIIPNGFDLVDFHPDPTAHPWLCGQLGIPADTLLIGLVARFDPQKDFETFLDAAQILSQTRLDTHFVLCGEGLDAQNSPLNTWIEARGLHPFMHLLGRRMDIARITAGFTIATLSSAYGEAFPNVIGEAMACAVPCVVTDVGDAGEMVAETGKVVPPRQAHALADAWNGLLSLEPSVRAGLGMAARLRIERNYMLSSVASQYANLYQELISQKQAHNRCPRNTKDRRVT